MEGEYMKAVFWFRSRGAEIKLPKVPEPKVRIAAPAPFYLPQT
jgi:hypothetical protein